YGVYAPIACDSGVAAFGRDPDSSRQVWSAEEGYPGDFWYRDFYRDIGFDLDYEYVRPYLPPTGQRIHTGLKYHRITGKTDQKEPYDPERARVRAQAHAEHFVDTRIGQVDWLARHMERPPIIVCPYDADARTRRALSQALRELLLGQASDWAFMMSRDTTVEYAVRRTKDHLLRCQRLCAEVEQGAIDELRLAALEDTDNLFPALDYRVL